ncbi:GNAT family N-acetyltransferase [Paenibacillus phocaensis]|uniref:GNAT family N-acetyltransferase n=1 Tax=Paenibacillus phocaensis TaxID=1776378 RepID=UPI0018E2477F|nr:GNAT family protein [Paenibacillus phocaensis]
MTFKLLKLTEANVSEYLPVIYRWAADETEKEYHTCRPIEDMEDYDVYREKFRVRLNQRQLHYVIIDLEDREMAGKINLFDYNPRNRSGEFGYYVPPFHRKKGVGRKMIGLFLEEIFHDENLNLNKVYATTASCNKPSIRLLESFHFKLEGTYREHYWFCDGSICDQYHYSLLRREFEEMTKLSVIDEGVPNRAIRYNDRIKS